MDNARSSTRLTVRSWRLAAVRKGLRPGLLVLGGLVLLPSLASATPSTTYWAPSTASCQAWAVPHVTYDTYFGKGPSAGSQGAPNYPIDTGLTVGFLPGKKVPGEVGFDLLLPSDYPAYFNAKLCHLAADVQTGKNVLGAWGFGAYFYFTDTIPPDGPRLLSR